MERRTLIKAIAALWRHLSPRRRRQLGLLFVVTILAAVAEVFSLGLLIPFLGVLTSPESVTGNAWFQSVFGEGLAGWAHGDLVALFAGIFCVAALVAGVVRLALLYLMTRFSQALGADLSFELYRRTLYQPFSFHIAHNSSELIASITTKTYVIISNVVSPLLSLASSLVLLVSILSALFIIDPLVTLISVGTFLSIYLVIMALTRERIRADSAITATESSQVVKALQEGLGGIRDVLIDGSQEVYSGIYRMSDRRLRHAQGRITITTFAPRFIVETVGMIFIALLALWMSRQGDPGEIIPVLGALALGAQRLLPVLQQAYSAIATVRGSEASFWDVLDLLERPLPASAEGPRRRLGFAREIAFRDVGFAYAEGTPVLAGMSLSIEKGQRLGIYGPTGGGKSTLLDVLMGLLEPTEGALCVDGVAITAANSASWQAHIAHVPQSIFLSDTTIAENIAFGVPAEEIDLERVKDAARRAQIAATIEALPLGYLGTVGERGVRLSGGQRQRIGMARALYKRADVIVLDEATSALDNATELALMEAIETLGREITVIMVAHRLTTLRGCDVVAEIVGGRVARMGGYGELIGGVTAAKQ